MGQPCNEKKQHCNYLSFQQPNSPLKESRTKNKSYLFTRLSFLRLFIFYIKIYKRFAQSYFPVVQNLFSTLHGSDIFILRALTLIISLFSLKDIFSSAQSAGVSWQRCAHLLTCTLAKKNSLAWAFLPHPSV